MIALILILILIGVLYVIIKPPLDVIVQPLTNIMSTVIGALTGALAVGVFSIFKPNRRGAQKRAKIVYNPLINELISLIDFAERVFPIDRLSDSINGTWGSVGFKNIDDSRYQELLISSNSKNKLKDFKKVANRYNKMGKIADNSMKQIMDDNIHSYLKKTQRKLEQDKEFSISGSINLNVIFKASRPAFLINAIKKESIDSIWFSKHYLVLKEELDKKLVEGNSLSRLFYAIDCDVKSESSFEFLREERENFLKVAKELKNLLERENRKLKAWHSYYLGAGNEITLEELEREQLDAKL